MRLKSANLHRSAGQEGEGKAAVQESDASDVVTALPRGRMESAPAAAAPPSRAADAAETLYLEHRTLLMYVACRKFRVPDPDAENLIQEVFLSFLQTATKIENIRAWLVAAMCNASRHYWRTQGRTESLPDNFADTSDPDTHALEQRFALRITIRQALDYLQPRCRETLWLHYFEGRSASDVARELETTNRYAEKLIHNCLKRVREIYLNITSVKK